MRINRALHTFSAAAFLCCVLQSAYPSSKALHQKPKHVNLTGRIVAHIPLLAYATVGLNHETYIVEVKSKKANNGNELIKLSYRFYLQDDPIPPTFLDYSLEHNFSAIRDESCDEAWSSLSTRFLSDQGSITDRKDALVYSKNAPAQSIEPKSVLPCFVMRPDDYHSKKTAPPAAIAGKDKTAK